MQMTELFYLHIINVGSDDHAEQICKLLHKNVQMQVRETDFVTDYYSNTIWHTLAVQLRIDAKRAKLGGAYTALCICFWSNWPRLAPLPQTP